MGQAKEVVDRFYELFAAGRLGDTVSLFSPDCVTLTPNGALNQAQHEEMGNAFKAAFPDAHMAVDQVVETGDEIVVLGHFQGTHTGDLQGAGGTIPASGNPLNLRFIDYFKVADGRIVDQQTIFDQMELLGQLGALPQP